MSYTPYGVSSSTPVKRTAAFPLDELSYFESLSAAETAAQTAENAGSTNVKYYFGQIVTVVIDGIPTVYKIEKDENGKGKLVSLENAGEVGEEVLRQAKAYTNEKVGEVTALIPEEATTTNQLADKQFVADSITQMTASYITKNAAGDPFDTKAALTGAEKYYCGGEEVTPDKNDYAVVLADESKEGATTRYIFQTTWQYQYTVNPTPFTTEQWAAINSTATADKIDQIATNTQDIADLDDKTMDLVVGAATDRIATFGTGGQVKDSGKTIKDITDITDGLDERLTTAEGEIDTLQTDVADLQTRMTTAESEIDALESAVEDDIEALKTRMTTAESDIDVLEGRMDTAEGDIDALESRMDTAESEIDILDGRMYTAESEIDALEGRMDTAEVDIDSLEDRMHIAESEIDVLEGRMDTAESEIDVLDDRITTAEGDIDALEGRMDTAEGDIDSLEDRMYTAETEIDALESNKVDKTTTIAGVDLKDSVTKTELLSALNVVDGATKVTDSTTNGKITVQSATGTEEIEVYAHPTTTATSAAFVKVGKDALGHVVLGDAITSADLPAHTHTTSQITDFDSKHAEKENVQTWTTTGTGIVDSVTKSGSAVSVTKRTIKDADVAADAAIQQSKIDGLVDDLAILGKVDEVKNTDGSITVSTETPAGKTGPVKATISAKISGITDNTLELKSDGLYVAPPEEVRLAIEKTTAASGQNTYTLKQNNVAVSVPVVVDTYSITKDETSTEYAAVYHLTKNGESVGEPINIAKDFLVKSGKIVETKVYQTGTQINQDDILIYGGEAYRANASVTAAANTGWDKVSDKTKLTEVAPTGGVKYLDFIINSKDDTSGKGEHIYISVADLVDVYTGGTGIDINSQNVVSFKMGNGLESGTNGNISVKSADASIEVDSNGVKVNVNEFRGLTLDTMDGIAINNGDGVKFDTEGKVTLDIGKKLEFVGTTLKVVDTVPEFLGLHTGEFPSNANLGDTCVYRATESDTYEEYRFYDGNWYQTSLSSELEELKQRVTNVESEISELDQRVTEAESTLTQHDSRLDVLESQTELLNESVTSLQLDVESLDSRVDELESLNIEERLHVLESETDNLDLRLDYAEDSIVDLQTQVNNLLVDYVNGAVDANGVQFQVVDHKIVIDELILAGGNSFGYES